MKTKIIPVLLWVMGCLAVFAEFSILTDPNAHADSGSKDQQYLDSLEAHGLHVTSEKDAIRGGHAVCSCLDDGMSIEAIIASTIAGNDHLSLDNARTLVYVAIGTFCPGALQ